MARRKREPDTTPDRPFGEETVVDRNRNNLYAMLIHRDHMPEEALREARQHRFVQERMPELFDEPLRPHRVRGGRKVHRDGGEG